MVNGSWVFPPYCNIFLECLDFGKREQDVIIKPASMMLN